MPTLGSLFRCISLAVTLSVCSSFAQQIEDTPSDMLISFSLWTSDSRWEIDVPDDQSFSWSSESLGVAAKTECLFRHRRSTEDAHAVILSFCRGFELDTIAWIFLDSGPVLWGVYGVDSRGFIGAIQDANRYLAYSKIGPAGKLSVWDGTFETGRATDHQSSTRSWGRIKAALRP